MQSRERRRLITGRVGAELDYRFLLGRVGRGGGSLGVGGESLSQMQSMSCRSDGTRPRMQSRTPRIDSRAAAERMASRSRRLFSLTARRSWSRSMDSHPIVVEDCEHRTPIVNQVRQILATASQDVFITLQRYAVEERFKPVSLTVDPVEDAHLHEGVKPEPLCRAAIVFIEDGDARNAAHWGVSTLVMIEDSWPAALMSPRPR